MGWLLFLASLVILYQLFDLVFPERNERIDKALSWFKLGGQQQEPVRKEAQAAALVPYKKFSARRLKEVEERLKSPTIVELPNLLDDHQKFSSQLEEIAFLEEYYFGRIL